MEKHLIEKLEVSSSPIKGNIAKIIKFSNVDGPGNRMAIFFQGCNFNCIYCHNPETIPFESCESKLTSIDDILNILKKVAPFIEGVTVSGGESTLQYRFVTELFFEIKVLYPTLTCFVDTNGSLDLSQKEFEPFLKITDSFMLDIKAWDEEHHKKITHSTNGAVLKNLDFLMSINKLYEVRTVIFKEELGSQEFENTVREIGKKIKNSSVKFKIINYRAHGVRDKYKDRLTTLTNNELEKIKEITIISGIKNFSII